MSGIATFPDLDQRLGRLPPGIRGLRRRAVLAMAVFDVPRATIAAVLDIGIEDLTDGFLEDLHAGEALRTLNTVKAAYAKAEAGHWPAISKMLDVHARDFDLRREEQEWAAFRREWRRHAAQP